MLKPKEGDYYRVQGKLNRIDEIIKIAPHAPDVSSVQPDRFFYATTFYYIIERDSLGVWSQYVEDFEGFVNGTNPNYNFTKILEEKNPEYFL